MADPRDNRPPGMYTPPAGTPNAVYGMQGLEFYDQHSVLRFWISRADTRAMVFDDAGVSRAEMGLLDANGISPAMYGFRANDASGAPIFDSLGLISVMTLLANSTLQSATNYVGAGSTSYADMTVNEPQQATFTLTRPTNVLLFTKNTARTSGGSGTFAYTQITLTGKAPSGLGLWDVRNVVYISDTTFVFHSLPAGTFIAKQQVAADVGQTLACNGGGIDVFQLGG